MDEEELVKLSCDLEANTSELTGVRQNLKIWSLLAALAVLSLIPSGIGALFLGVVLFWVGVKWFKYHTLTRICEFEVFRSALAREELEKIQDKDS